MASLLQASNQVRIALSKDLIINAPQRTTGSSMNLEFALMHVSRGAVLKHELAVAIGTFHPALSAHV